MPDQVLLDAITKAVASARNAGHDDQAISEALDLEYPKGLPDLAELHRLGLAEPLSSQQAKMIREHVGDTSRICPFVRHIKTSDDSLGDEQRNPTRPHFDASQTLV